MELAARRYIIKVLVIHGILLLLVLGAVAAGVQYLYNSARQQAIEHAKYTQRLLAQQTALGIANYYQSVTRVLDILQPSEEEAANPPASRSRATEARRRALESGPLRRMLSNMGEGMWLSIKDKASMLFVVDMHEDFEVVATIGTTDEQLQPAEVVKAARIWLQTAKTSSVSPYFTFPSGGGHVVAVPMRGPAGLMMVCVVPIASLQRDVLRYLNSSSVIGALVFDSHGNILNVREEAADYFTTIDKIEDSRVREMMHRLQKSPAGVSEVFEHFQSRAPRMPAGMLVTVEPVDVFEQKWFVGLGSPLNEIDAIVRPIFRDAMVWGAILMLAMTGLFISTSIQLIRTRLKVERAQMEALSREVAQARQIQLNWLPTQPCSFRSIEIAAANKPASHVSGDFYNWFELPDGRIAIAIGDVTGHGMAAAFLMATTQFLVRATMQRVPDPGTCLTEVNKHVCTMTFSGQFVTILLLVLDPRKHELLAASAGHYPPLVGLQGRYQETKFNTDLVMGVDRDVTYTTHRQTLEPGCALLLYTDGVVEAASPNGQRLWLSGLTQCLNGRVQTPAAVVQRVLDAVNEFCQGADPADDLTLVAVGLPGNAAQNTG